MRSGSEVCSGEFIEVTQGTDIPRLGISDIMGIYEANRLLLRCFMVTIAS